MCFFLFVYQIAFSFFLVCLNCLNLNGSRLYSSCWRLMVALMVLTTGAPLHLCTYIRGEPVLLLYSSMKLSRMCLKQALFLLKPLKT